MKRRINPVTGVPFKHGEVSANGKVFWGYRPDGGEYWMEKDAFEQALIRNRKKVDERLETQEGRIKNNLANIRSKCKREGIPFNLDLEYVKSLLTANCPVFDTPLVFGLKGKQNKRISASIDRVIPELGYVKGNVVFISKIANTIKQDVTEQELYAVADWLYFKRKEVEDVFKDELARLSEKHSDRSEKDAESWAIYGARSGEDCDGSHHHTRESEGQNTCDSTKASCGICMGAGDKELGTSKLYQMWISDGHTSQQIESLAKQLGCICHQSGERGVVDRQLALPGI